MKNDTTGPDMFRNLLTHLLNPKVNTVSKLFQRSQLAPLDFNLILWNAVDGQIIDIKDNKIKIVNKEFKQSLVNERNNLKPWSTGLTHLQRQCWKTMRYYQQHNQYVPQVEFLSWAINASQAPIYEHDAIIGALNWLEDAGLIYSVSAINPRDAAEDNPTEFVFYYITERPDGVSSLFEKANQPAS